MTYLISYYYKNDLEKRHQKHDTMQMALAVANLLYAKGDYVIDSITTEYDGKEGAFRALDRLYDENKEALSNLDDDYDTPIVMEDEE